MLLFVCLILKKHKALRVVKFRRISLVTSAERDLRSTLSVEQVAFLKGRQMLDAVLIANDVVEEYRRSKKEALIFNIDFEKAFDHVDRNFFDFVLEDQWLGEKDGECGSIV